MKDEEIKKLIDKILCSDYSSEEKLQLIKELNNNLSSLANSLNKINASKQLNLIRKSLDN